MFRVLTLNESNQWDQIVCTFSDYDVYNLSGYVKAFVAHGDGEALLLNYESENLRAINVVMKREIASFKPFEGILKSGKWFDSVTPYGYGGFVFEGEATLNNLLDFFISYKELLEKKCIVSDFVRYSPVLKNVENGRGFFDITDLGSTISLDLSSEDIIWNNITSKNRNMIRKAQKSGVTIEHGKDPKLFEKFISIYNSTMDKDQASSYYYFDKKFYDSIQTDLYNNYEMFYAILNQEIIAMSIIIFANKKMHYHLSGSDMTYRSFAPTNLLLYEAACWGARQGFLTFHLGGGFGAGCDSLYKFKEGFNRNSNNIFSIGRYISNQQMYDRFVSLRKENDPDFTGQSNYFPLYRAICDS